MTENTDPTRADASPRRVPPSPPRIPLRRRATRSFLRWWPAFVWCVALASAVWLYSGFVDHGRALAREELVEVHASSSVDGRIATLLVEAGQEVTVGDAVAALDVSDVDARLDFARRRLERARTRIGAAREELQQDARDRRAQAAARLASHASEGRRIRDVIDAVTAKESSDRAGLLSLTPQLERLRPLAEGSLIRRDRLEELEQSRALLEARLTAHAARRHSAQRELALWEEFAPAAVIDGDLQVRLVPFELELEAQQALVTELELERQKHTILAPASGVVGEILARAGEWRDAGVEILSVVVPVPDRATAYVLGASARAVERGSPARLRPRDRTGKPLVGRVVSVGARMELIPRQLRGVAAIPEWGRRVSIEIRNPSPPLPGEIYTVSFR